MTDDQTHHVRTIQTAIQLRIAAKYHRGQLEHGGNLWERPALPEIIDELTDLVSYVHCMEEQCEELLILTKTARQAASVGHYGEADDVLETMETRLYAQLTKSKGHIAYAQ